MPRSRAGEAAQRLCLSPAVEDPSRAEFSKHCLSESTGLRSRLCIAHSPTSPSSVPSGQRRWRRRRTMVQARHCLRDVRRRAPREALTSIETTILSGRYGQLSAIPSFSSATPRKGRRRNATLTYGAPAVGDSCLGVVSANPSHLNHCYRSHVYV